MARITVEDCLEKIDNRFAMVHAAATRVRQLDKGSKRLGVPEMLIFLSAQHQGGH